MTADLDDLLDDLFLGCALAAFLQQARAERCWPDGEATRRRAYRLYEDALAEENGSPVPLANPPPGAPKS